MRTNMGLNNYCNCKCICEFIAGICAFITVLFVVVMYYSIGILYIYLIVYAIIYLLTKFSFPVSIKYETQNKLFYLNYNETSYNETSLLQSNNSITNNNINILLLLLLFVQLFGICYWLYNKCNNKWNENKNSYIQIIDKDDEIYIQV